MHSHNSAWSKPWICHCTHLCVIKRCKHNMRAIVWWPNCFRCCEYFLWKMEKGKKIIRKWSERLLKKMKMKKIHYNMLWIENKENEKVAAQIEVDPWTYTQKEGKDTLQRYSYILLNGAICYVACPLPLDANIHSCNIRSFSEWTTNRMVKLYRKFTTYSFPSFRLFFVILYSNKVSCLIQHSSNG